MKLGTARREVFTFLRSLCGSWHFGGATRSRSRERALRGYGRALASIDDPRVDFDAPWCRAVLPLAVVGYVQAAQELGRADEAMTMLVRWQLVYRRWIVAPLTAAERDALDWLETIPTTPRS